MDFQQAYARQAGPTAKSLPDCTAFQMELVNTNMLVRDLFAPRGRIDFDFGAVAQEVEFFDHQDGSHEQRSLMTNTVLSIVEKAMEALVACAGKLPSNLAAMLRIVLAKHREVEPGVRVEISRGEAYLLGDLLAGCYISNGFKWVECMGLTPPFKEESRTVGHLLQAARVLLESTLTCEPLPYTHKPQKTFKISRFNEFIASWEPKVVALYQSILDGVDMRAVAVPAFSEIKNLRRNYRVQNAQASQMRLQDLATLELLMQSSIQEDAEFLNQCTMKLNFPNNDAVMINKNEPAKVRAMLAELKKNLVSSQVRITKVQRKKYQRQLDFWEANYDKYVQTYWGPNQDL